MIQRIRKNENKLSIDMYKNVILNYGFRGIGIILGLVSTSVNLSYLGNSIYGQWATIASVAAWINTGDFGIGNGFRNEFVKAVAHNDIQKQKELIATTFRVLGLVALGLFLLLFLIIELLVSLNIVEIELRVPMYITNFFFCTDLFLGVGRAAAYGFQKSWLISLAQVTTVVIRILGILGLKALFSPNLIAFSIINGVGGLIGNIVLLIILNHISDIKFKNKLSNYFNYNLIRNITKLGLQFFVLQISSLVLYSTDNLIINKLFTSEMVTKYSLITKIYTTGEGLFSILLISLWSAVTYAITKMDFDWIKKEIKRLLLLWGFFSICVVAISLFFNKIMYLWLGNNSIKYESNIVALFAVYTIAVTFGSIFVNVSNGMGRLKVQLAFSSIEAIVNIPLSVFLAKQLGMGIYGVKLATLVCCIGAIIFVPCDVVYQLHKRKKLIIKGK